MAALSARLRTTASLAVAAFAFAGIAVATAIPARADLAKSMRIAVADNETMAMTTEPPPVPLMVRIDLSDQKMFVYVGETLINTFPVSTARAGYITPPGRYQPQWLAAMWRSRKYNFAPMPWSVFFYGGYAIHGTTDVYHLGRPASHGCVRLLPANAKLLYTLVQKTGRDNTLITIVR